MTSEDEVRVERHDSVALLVLAAPARRNALTATMAEQLLACCDAIDADDAIGAVVVAGDGGYFCAGADLSVLAVVGEDPAEDTNFHMLDAIYSAFRRVGHLRPPTISAIEGGAIGAGLNLALSTDIRVMSESAVLTAGFVKIGVHPGGGGLTLLHRLAGREAAAAMILFGESITGVQARHLGLAWDAVANERVIERSLELAHRAAIDPKLARLATRSLRTEADARIPLDVAVEYERSAQMWSLRRRAMEHARASQ